jgi:ParB-like chromosome segregation protein Spo0J
MLNKPPKIELRDIESLIPYINNSRKHSDEQIDAIAGSIKEFGWTSPILVDGDNGLIAGHGRLLAARKLGIVKIPSIELAHLTETQKKALIIADNKIALNSEWDYNLLKLEIEHLKDQDFNVDLLGFHPSELVFNDVDYSVLDDAPDSINEQLDDMADGIRKAIQIEFEPDHYAEAQELVSWWRKQGAYIGYMLIELLRKEKAKHEE